jgi:hypothetical protein
MVVKRNHLIHLNPRTSGHARDTRMGMGMMNSQSADASESQDQWSCPGYRSGMAMGMGMMNMMPMMHNMMHNAYQNGMMNSDFSKLEENFNNMMKIDDLKELKSAMKDHYAMMQEYSEKIKGQAGTCAYGNMMSMMESCGMHGVRQNEGSMHKGNMHNEEEDI